MRRACGIQARLPGARWGGTCCDEIDHVQLADAVSDGRALVMVVLEAELSRATGTGGDGVVDYAVTEGSCGAVVACQFVGLEVQASAGVIACGADEVRILGWARVNSAADLAFVF